MATKKAAAKSAKKVAAPVIDKKMAAAGEKADAQAVAAVAIAEPKKPAPAPKKAEKVKEEFVGDKLRAKGDIVKALGKGGLLFLAPEGLYRMLNADGSKTRVSKRRASTMISNGDVVLTKQNGGKYYSLAPKKDEPKK